MKYLITLLMTISLAQASECYYAEYSNYEKEVVIIYDGDSVVEKPITLDEYFKEYID